MFARIKALMDSRNITAYRLSKDLNISRSTISDWKSGKTTPKAESLSKIADYFDVPLTYFYADDIDVVNDMSAGSIPIYDVAAGEGRVNGEHATEYMKAEHDEETSYIRIHGDSMLPELRDGDLVKVHHQTETAKTDYTVVKVDGETATIKFVEVTETGVWIKALNKEVFEDRFYSVKEVLSLPVKIVGKAVEVTRKLP